MRGKVMWVARLGQIGEGMLGVWKRGGKVGGGEDRDGGEGVVRVER